MGECGKTIIKCRGKEIELPKGIEAVARSFLCSERSSQDVDGDVL